MPDPYLEKYILESYLLMNDARKGIQRMKNRYRMMVESPLTTLWEGWEIGSHTHGGGSYNHGWSGGPLILMSQYLAGVQPGDDGFQRVLIKPQMGDLRWIECTVPHRKGLIIVNFERESGTLQARITLPAGLTGTLVWNNQNRNLHEGFQEVKF
ncbi:MAG: alpha-L-rhamnosidase C-terminal domain-containing protein [Mangrovibacterium sp.]